MYEEGVSFKDALMGDADLLKMMKPEELQDCFSAGYHVRHDLELAVRGRPHHVVAGALGPDPRLSALLARRLGEVAGEPGTGDGGRRERLMKMLWQAVGYEITFDAEGGRG